jgi:hypothetical protein
MNYAPTAGPRPSPSGCMFRLFFAAVYQAEQVETVAAGEVRRSVPSVNVVTSCEAWLRGNFGLFTVDHRLFRRCAFLSAKANSASAAGVQRTASRPPAFAA